MPMTQVDRVFHDLDRKLQLEQADPRLANGLLGGIHIGRGHGEVGPAGHGDGLLAVVSHDDYGGAAGGSRGGSDPGAVDSLGFQAGQELTSEIILAHSANHHCRGAQSGGSHRLVRPSAARCTGGNPALRSPARGGDVGRMRHEIHMDAADDDDRS